MGKVEINKREKKNALLSTAFDLFTDQGFSKTTISDIVNKAGLAKGTFYLYFKDKYDLRDKLIIHKAGQLFSDAMSVLSDDPSVKPDDQVMNVVDYMVNRLKNDLPLLALISKNLSWGIFQTAFEKTLPEQSENFYRYYMDMMEASDVSVPQPHLMLFTIIELVGSTCYSCILYNQPVSIDEYMPYLHTSIRNIIAAFTSGEPEREARAKQA